MPSSTSKYLEVPQITKKYLKGNDFKYSNSTTSVGHPLGYDEYMRKNFIITITFPTLANVANIYFYLKVGNWSGNYYNF